MAAVFLNIVLRLYFGFKRLSRWSGFGFDNKSLVNSEGFLTTFVYKSVSLPFTALSQNGQEFAISHFFFFPLVVAIA